MARRRSRFIQNRRERDADRSGPDPAASMRLAVFVALVLVLIAAAAGFQGDRFASGLARWISVLGPLAEPVIFGASWLEIAAGAGVLALIVVMVVRSLRS